VDREGLGQQRQDPLGAAGDVEVGGDQGELVRAQPADQLAAGGVGLQPRADLGQQQVAAGVAKAVVEVLEAVEVDDEQRHPFPGSLGPGQPLAQGFGEGAAVDQAG
jgi:hypothetical protein